MHRSKHVIQIEGLAQVRNLERRELRLHVVRLGPARTHVDHHDAARGALVGQGAQHPQSIESAQRVVQEDDPRSPLARQQREGLDARRHGAHVVAFLFEDEAQHIAEVFVGIHDEHPLPFLGSCVHVARAGHRPSPRAG